MLKFPDIRASSLVVIAGGFQSLANIAFLSVCSKNYSSMDYSLIPLYFTLQGLMRVFCYQGIDSMINRAMLNNHFNFFHKAINSSLKLSFIGFFLLSICLLIAYLVKPIESNYLILFVLLIFQLPITSLEKIECTLLGLNKFKELIRYKGFSSLISLVPLIGSLYGINIIWTILSIILTRLIVASISINLLKNWFRRTKKYGENYDSSFYIKEANKLSFLAVTSTFLNYIWPLILYKIDPISLSLFFNGSKIPERIKDYSKLFVSIPSQHWLKKGKEHFSQKIKAKGVFIFFFALLFSIVLALSAKIYMIPIFGEEYSESILIAQILFLSIPARVLSSLHQSREIYHEMDTSFFRKSNYIQAVINLILAVPMVYYFKEVGLAFHNLIMSYAGYLISLMRFKRTQKA